MKVLRSFVWASLLLGCASCAPAIITLLTAAPAARQPPGSSPLEVTARAAGVPSPLRMHGARVAWNALEESLGRSVTSATMPWADAHRAERAGGWQLLVELAQASAERRGAMVTVRLGVRATLRTHDGNVYLAQTQAHCQQSLLVDAEQAAPVFYECIGSIGRELAGWLGGVTP